MDVALPDVHRDAEQTALTKSAARCRTKMFVSKRARAAEGLDYVLDGDEDRDGDDASGAHGTSLASLRLWVVTLSAT